MICVYLMLLVKEKRGPLPLDDAALGRCDLRVLELHGPPPDHPTLPSFPEGRYLKLAILE